MTENKLIIKERILNKKLASVFDEFGIKNFRLISLGNSIASGYSMVRTTKPLLLRNSSLQEIMALYDINLERYHFARAQNNNDEHIFEWLTQNIKESDIYQMNRQDYSNSASSMKTHGLTEEKITEYYPKKPKYDNGLQDLVLSSDDKTANIVIYNGCTGSFLDNITRKGKFQNKLFYGINQDATSLEATLKFIQNSNRVNGTNTQVYICGAPNFLGLGISEAINRKLKKIAKKYANTVYVKPIKSKFFYKEYVDDDEKNIEKSQSFLKRHLPSCDIHYDEKEYIAFNNAITKSITESYLATQSLINIDRRLYYLSKNMELYFPEVIGDKNAIAGMLENILMAEEPQISKTPSPNQTIKNIFSYVNERYPSDFYYADKSEIKSSFDKIRAKRD